MCDCVCDKPKVYKESLHKANKSHWCCECTRLINKGEYYTRVFGIWDAAQTFKICGGCWVMYEYFKSQDICVCYTELMPSLKEWLIDLDVYSEE